jgi:hypothetical protein
MSYGGLEFDPATDIYSDSPFYQEAIHQSQLGMYRDGRFDPSYSRAGQYPGADFAAGYGKGYYQYANFQNRLMPWYASLASSSLLGRTPVNLDSKSLGYKIDAYDNSRAYSRGRSDILADQVYRTWSDFAERVALQRGRSFLSEDRKKLHGMTHSGLGRGAISAISALSPQEFEQAFGRAGSGIGIYDAAFNEATYRRHSDYSRWTPGERTAYAKRAMDVFYNAPGAREERLFNSVDTGMFYTYLSSQGLLGRPDEYEDLSNKQTVETVRDYFLSESANKSGAKSKAVHERVQRVDAINTARDNMSRLRNELMSGRLEPKEYKKVRTEYEAQYDHLRQLQETETAAGGYRFSHPMPDPSKESVFKGGQTDVTRITAALNRLAEVKRPGWFKGDRTKEVYDAEREVMQSFKDAGIQDMRGMEPLGQRMRKWSTEDSLNLAKTIADAAETEQHVNKVRQQVGENFKGVDFGKDENYQNWRKRRTEEIAKGTAKYDEFYKSDAGGAKIAEIKGLFGQYAQTRGKDEASAEKRQELMRKAWNIAGGEMDVVSGLLPHRFMNDFESRFDFEDSKSLSKSGLYQEASRSLQELTVDAYKKEMKESVKGGARGAAAAKLADQGLATRLHDVDTSELNIDSLVSMQEAMIALGENGDLRKFVQNTAKLKSAGSRYAEYEKSLKALQESMTSGEGSPAKLLDTFNAFAGGNIQQLNTQDLTQMRHGIRRTYALAAGMGQGDDYVAAHLQTAAAMAGVTNVNRKFVGLLAEQNMARESALYENNETAGMWGAGTLEETSMKIAQATTGYIGSEAGNRYGAMLRMMKALPNKGTNTQLGAYLEAVRRGDSTFIYEDSDGNRSRRSTAINDAELQRLWTGSGGTGSVNDFLEYGEANQAEVYKNRDALPFAQRTHQVSGAFDDIAHRVRQKFSQRFGTADATTHNLYAEITRGAAEDLFDRDVREEAVTGAGLDQDDHGRVYMELVKRRAEKMLTTGTQEQQAAAKTFLDNLGQSGGMELLSSAAGNAVNQAVAHHLGLNIPTAYTVHGKQAIWDAEHKKVSAAAESKFLEATGNIFAPTVIARMRETLAYQTQGYRDAVQQGAAHEEAVKAANISDLSVAMAGFSFLDLRSDSAEMKSVDRTRELSETMGRLQHEIVDVRRNDSLSPEEKESRIKSIQEKYANAERQFNESAVQMNDLLRTHTVKSDSVTSPAMAQLLRMETNKLNQVIAQQDKNGGVSYGKLADDQIQLDKNTYKLRVKRSDGQFEDKADAVYTVDVREELKDSSGNALKDENGRVRTEMKKYRMEQDEEGKWFYNRPKGDGTMEKVKFDPKDESKSRTHLMNVGSGLYTADGKNKTTGTAALKQSDYFWENNILYEWKDGVGVRAERSGAEGVPIEWRDKDVRALLSLPGVTSKHIEAFLDNRLQDEAPEVLEKLEEVRKRQDAEEAKSDKTREQRYLQGVVDSNLKQGALSSVKLKTEKANVAMLDEKGNEIKDANGQTVTVEDEYVKLHGDSTARQGEHKKLRAEAMTDMQEWSAAGTDEVSQKKKAELESKWDFDAVKDDLADIRKTEAAIADLDKEIVRERESWGQSGPNPIRQKAYDDAVKDRDSRKGILLAQKNTVASKMTRSREAANQVEEVNKVQRGSAEVDISKDTGAKDAVAMMRAFNNLVKEDDARRLQEAEEQNIPAVKRTAEEDQELLKQADAQTADYRVHVPDKVSWNELQDLDKLRPEDLSKMSLGQKAVFAKAEELAKRGLKEVRTEKGKKEVVQQLPSLEENDKGIPAKQGTEITAVNIEGKPVQGITGDNAVPPQSQQRGMGASGRPSTGQPSSGTPATQPEVSRTGKVKGSRAVTGEDIKTKAGWRERAWVGMWYSDIEGYNYWEQKAAKERERTGQAQFTGVQPSQQKTSPQPSLQPPSLQPPSPPPVSAQDMLMGGSALMDITKSRGKPPAQAGVPQIEIPTGKAKDARHLPDLPPLPPLSTAPQDRGLKRETGQMGGERGKKEVTLLADNVQLNINEASFKNGSVALSAEGHGFGKGFSPTMLPS